MKTVKSLIPIITLCMFILGSINTMAQTRYSEKEVKEKLSQTTLSLVQSAKPFYSKGDSYDTFTYKLYGNQSKFKPSQAGENLMKKVYFYLTSNASDSKILNDIPKEMGEAVIFVYNYEKANKGKNGEIALFSTTTGDFWPETTSQQRCCFFCFRCHLIKIFGENGGDAIVDALVDVIVIWLGGLN